MGVPKGWSHLSATVTAFLSPRRLPLKPGLRTYPVALEGGQRRLHLRIGEEGSGTLFVDVTEVIHLNSTATLMAVLALEGVPPAKARQILRRSYSGVRSDHLARELQMVYDLIERLTSAEGCPTCAVASLVEFQPIFSTPVDAPFKADVALTYGCNNACAHCYNEAGRLGMASLALDDWLRILDTLARIGVPHLILTGGEPTLHPDLIPIIRHANRLGQIVGMNTNGRRLSHRPTVEAIVEAGLDHVQITLESCYPEVHNAMVGSQAFEQTVQGIRNSVACGLHTITNTTLTQHNQGHALETVDFLHDLGLRTFAMNGMIYAGGGSEDPAALPADKLAALLTAVRDRADELGMRFLWYTVTDYCQLSPLALDLDPKRCNAAEYSICVEPNGDVLPCQSYYVPAGNLLKDPWESIWNSSLFLSFRNRNADPEGAGLPQACWDCPDLEICGGGCRLEHEARCAVRAAERGCARSRVEPMQGMDVACTTGRATGRSS